MSDTTYVDYTAPAVNAEWLNEINDHVWNDAPVSGSAVHSATVISNTPSGNIAATDVQTALNELDTEKVAISDLTASYVPNVPAGNIVATDVQAAINELDTEKASLSSLAADTGSQLIGWKQLGTGAVSRTVEARLRDRVNAKDFGVVGDGITNDAPAIQLAVDYVKTSGKVLYFPAGSYLCNSSITFETTSSNTFTNGLSIVGEGIGKTVFINASNSILFNILTNTASKFQLGGELSGFSITVSGTSTSAIGINFKSAYAYKVSDFRIVGGMDGVRIVSSLGDADASNNITFDRGRIEDCTAWGIEFAVGAGVNEISFIGLRNVIIQSCGTLDGVGGGMFWKGQALYMENAAFVLCKNRGLYIEGGAGLANTCYGVNTVFENNLGKALECWGVQGLQLDRSQCYANDASYVGANKGHLFYFNGGSFVIRNVELNGVVVRATAANTPITAFHSQGANADAHTIRTKDVTWDNFVTTGQTKYSTIYSHDRESVIAYRAAAFNLTTTPTLLPFDTELLDTGSFYTAATGKFVPESSRAYRWSAQLQYTPSGSGEALIVALYNITDAATVQQQIIRSTMAAVEDYLFEFSQVLTSGKEYGLYVSNASGTRALSTGSSVSRLLIQAI